MNDDIEPKKAGKKPRVSLGTKLVAKVLTETGMTHAEAAKELHISENTLERAIADPNLDRQLVERAKFVLPVKMYSVAMKLAERLDNNPEAIKKLNPYMCALVMAIMIDKSRLMQGQSTENFEIQGKVLQVQAALSEIAMLKEKLGTPHAPTK